MIRILAAIPAITFTTIGLLFLFSAIRTFTSTLYMSLYGTVPNETVAAIGLATFGASIGGAIVGWRTSPRRALALSGTILALATVLTAVSRWNWGDLVFSAVAVVAGTWWIAFTQSARSGEGASPLAVGLPLALVADLALRAGFRTVAVVDLPGPIAPLLPLAGGLAMLGAGAAAYGADVKWTAPGLRGGLALVAIPVLLLVSETGGIDPAQAAVAGALGKGPEGPGTWYWVGALLGTAMTAAAGAVALGRVGGRALAAIALALGALALWSHVPYLATLGAAVLAAGVMVAAAALPDTAMVPARSPLATAACFTLGWLGFIAAAFAFFGYDTPVAPLAATAVVLLGIGAASLPVTRPLGIVAVAVIAVLGIGVPLAALVTTPSVATDQAPHATFRLMTYNIHQGFDAGDEPDLDALADTIARESPDVVVLQEVARGRMIGEQHDALTYLAERLGMQYVFGPTMGDGLGNAVLSRLPVSEVEYLSYERDPEARHEPRGAIFFRVSDVLVVATQLDRTPGASDVRQGQVHGILAKWNSRAPAVVAGDLSARPGSPELALLEQAGLRDLAKQDGAEQPTSPSADPRDRIDYVWGTGVTGTQAHTVSSTASDHRPLVITIARP